MTREENELLTRTGPGTPMGEVMRRYWVPAALSTELPEADGAPVRVNLLGEKLVAFRDTQGRIGLLEEFCAHRRASLFLGRNEESGLRCVYHGWKYDVDGNCVDMPNEPPETNYKDKIRLKAYPTVELGILNSAISKGRKINCPVELELLRIPRAKPRRATNQRLATVAPSTAPSSPTAIPIRTPHKRMSCQSCCIWVVAVIPMISRVRLIRIIRRGPKRSMSHPPRGAVRP